VCHGRLQQERAGDAEDAVAVADDADVPGSVQRHGEREVGGSTEAVLQGAGLVEHERVRRGQHPARTVQADGQFLRRHVAGARSHLQEVDILPSPLPQPGGIAYEVIQSLRRGVEQP
jgi:hypothetical protein